MKVQMQSHDANSMLGADEEGTTWTSALTGRPDFFNSARSRTRPLTTQPRSPLIFILAAMIPPTAAQVCVEGCSMTRMVSSSASSAQWLPLGIACRSSGLSGSDWSLLSTSLRVLALAITLGCSSIPGANGEIGAKGTVVFLSRHGKNIYIRGRIPRSARYPAFAACPDFGFSSLSRASDT